MKVIELSRGIGINNLQMAEQPKPNPKQREVLVKIEAASLNYLDLLVVKGLVNPDIPLPYIPVCDGAGVVEANRIHPVIDKIFSFEQTQAAFEYLEKGSHFGKIVITF